MSSDVSVVTTPRSIEHCVAQYLHACQARGLARSTTEDIYGRTLRRVFIPWCISIGIDDVGRVDQRGLDSFTVTLLSFERGLSRGSVHTYARTVKQFLRWVRAEEAGTSLPLPRLPAVPRAVIRTLTRSEIGRLEAAADNERDLLILRILAETGLRVCARW